jgi:hypothetical protein
MGISLQAEREREKKKKKKNMMTELADAPRGKPLVVFHSSHDWKKDKRHFLVDKSLIIKKICPPSPPLKPN